MPKTETICGKFDPEDSRQQCREVIGDEIYEEFYLDLYPTDDISLECFIQNLRKQAEGMNDPKIVRHGSSYYDYNDSVTYGLWHTRPATELELRAIQEHRAKEAERARKRAESQKKRNAVLKKKQEEAERKQYERLKKKFG
jgi:hypothetical protein